MRSFTFRLFLLVTIGFLARSSVANGPAHRRHFRVQMMAEGSTSIDGKAVALTADTVFQYYRETISPTERLVGVDVMHVKVDMQGQPPIDSYMDKTKVILVEDGEATEVAAENTPDELKSMLRDTFEHPILRIRLSPNGEIIDRKSVARPGAQKMVDDRVDQNFFLFHPPYFADKDTWTSSRLLAIGNGSVAKGELTYHRIGTEGNLTRVKVTGTMHQPAHRRPGSPLTFTDTKLAIQGEQTYDQQQAEWVTGKLTIKSDNDIQRNNEVVGEVTDNKKITFKLLE